MELKDYLRALRMRWRTIVLWVVLGVLAASALALSMTPMYKASTELFVAPKSGNTSQELVQGNSFIQNRVNSYLHLINSQIVLQPVINQLGLVDSVESLAPRVDATVPTDTVVLSVSVTDPSPVAAAEIANAVAQQFIKVAASIEPIRDDRSSVVTITVVEPAVAPTEAFSPDIKLIVGLGLLIGLAVGLSLGVARELTDKRIRRESDIKAISDAPIVGHIPVDKSAPKNPILIGATTGLRGEATRELRTNLQFLDVKEGHRSYVFTSPLAGDGKSTLAINLALMQAEAGLSVCLVDADLRRPSIATYLDLEDSIGLTDVLIGAAAPEFATQAWGKTRLDVIPSGRIPPNPSELLSGDAMQKLLTHLESLYDVVIIDAPPLLSVTDATILVKRTAGAIVVVGLGRNAATKAQLSRSFDSLTVVEARVLGVVINKIPTTGADRVTFGSYSHESVGSPEPSADRAEQVQQQESVRPSMAQ